MIQHFEYYTAITLPVRVYVRNLDNNNIDRCTMYVVNDSKPMRDKIIAFARPVSVHLAYANVSARRHCPPFRTFAIYHSPSNCIEGKEPSRKKLGFQLRGPVRTAHDLRRLASSDFCIDDGQRGRATCISPRPADILETLGITPRGEPLCGDPLVTRTPWRPQAADRQLPGHTRDADFLRSVY
jgi:hypothetical protein